MTTTDTVKKERKQFSFPNIKEFMSLPWNKQVDRLSRLYIKVCIEPHIVKQRKYTSTLFPIRNFFIKQERGTMYKLYDYLMMLTTVDGEHYMSMTTCFIKSDQYQEKMRMQKETRLQGEVKQYSAYEVFLRDMNIKL